MNLADELRARCRAEGLPVDLDDAQRLGRAISSLEGVRGTETLDLLGILVAHGRLTLLEALSLLDRERRGSR